MVLILMILSIVFIINFQKKKYRKKLNLRKPNIGNFQILKKWNFNSKNLS